MKSDQDNAMKNTIENWGLPDFLRNFDSDVIYKFDDKGNDNPNDDGYHFQDDSVKFRLFIPSLGLNIFSMEFLHTPPEKNNGLNEIWLELIWVRLESFRNKGIATYYMEKLIDHAISEKMDCIKLTAATDAEIFEGTNLVSALPQKELIKFYKRFDSHKMKIIINNAEM